jgi:hypothetical protein
VSKEKELKFKYPTVFSCLLVVVCECGLILGLSHSARRIPAGNICMYRFDMGSAVTVCSSFITCTIICIASYKAVYSKAKLILQRRAMLEQDDGTTTMSFGRRVVVRQVLNVVLLIFSWGGVFAWAVVVILSQAYPDYDWSVSRGVTTSLQIVIFLHGLGDVLVHVLSNPAIRWELYDAVGAKPTELSILGTVVERIMLFCRTSGCSHVCIACLSWLAPALCVVFSWPSLVPPLPCCVFFYIAPLSQLSLPTTFVVPRHPQEVHNGRADHFSYKNMGSSLSEFDRMDSTKYTPVKTDKKNGKQRFRVATPFGCECWGCCGFVEIEQSTSMSQLSFSCLEESMTAKNLLGFTTGLRRSSFQRSGSGRGLQSSGGVSMSPAMVNESRSPLSISHQANTARASLGIASPPADTTDFELPGKDEQDLASKLELSELGLIIM